MSVDDNILDAGDMNPGYYPDGILAPPPGLAATSIGLVPITAVRGGIKYPTPQERKDMAPRDREEILNDLDNAEGEIHKLLHRQAALRAELQRAIPPVPPPAYHRYSMEIKFASHGKKYEFLLLRKGGQWFTTGTSADTKRFDNWEALVKWLTGPDVYWYSEMRVLYKGTEIYSFAEGTVITDPTGSEPAF